MCVTMYCQVCGHVGRDEPYETDHDVDDPDGWAVCPECGNTNIGGYPSYADVNVIPEADLPKGRDHDGILRS